ncbi:MAG: hypothetical protein HKN72_09945 [Gemmatimonadetes bacterium]|nr:hypothetical protein [Gemmatimonadota bacterium]
MNGAPRSYLLVVNPVSGRGGGRSRAAALADALSDPSNVDVAETRERGEATEIASERGPDYDRVIAVGGDGTLNEVLTGLWSLGRTAHELPELGFLPSGTANAAAPAFNLRTEPVEVARSLEASDLKSDGSPGATSRPVDVGLVRSAGGDRPFLLWCGAGYDAVVIDALNSARTGQMGILGLVRRAPGVAASIARYQESPVRAVVDSDVWTELGGVIVANVADIAFGGTIAGAADAFDGRLDVVAVSSGVKARLPLLGLSMLGSGLQSARAARWAPASHVELSSPGKVPVQIDGEPAGQLPIEVRVVPGGIRLLLT